MSKDTTQKAREHFQATLDQVPEAVTTLARHAPEAMEGYLALRNYVHREPPHGELDAATRELLFIALDVAAGHVDGAKAHVESALAAGASVGAITQALTITMMISGIHTWSQHGFQVVDYAEQLASRMETTG